MNAKEREEQDKFIARVMKRVEIKKLEQGVNNLLADPAKVREKWERLRKELAEMP
jgi:hypothetical protein